METVQYVHIFSITVRAYYLGRITVNVFEHQDRCTFLVLDVLLSLVVVHSVSKSLVIF